MCDPKILYVSLGSSKKPKRNRNPPPNITVLPVPVANDLWRHLNRKSTKSAKFAAKNLTSWKELSPRNPGGVKTVFDAKCATKYSRKSIL